MEIQSPTNVKIIIGLIYSPGSDVESCLQRLIRIFGPIDSVSNEYAFDITDYYEKEMGKDLKRKFISFEKLTEPHKISMIKRITNIVELGYSDKSGRRINLDPGYLDLDKFVLASAKYGRQKIYLSGGIYADPTLYYFNKSYHAFDWSFPDFSSGIYHPYFMSVRILYKKQIKQI